MNSLVYELPLVFMSGVLGSAHCIGMCGAISATMNLGTNSAASAFRRQALWSFGRIFTYAFLGMVAGAAGARLSKTDLASSESNLLIIQAAFAITAGLLLVVQGLLASGLIKRKVTSQAGCITASIFGKFLRGGSALAVFVAGLLTGFLPCGLVYSFLALSAATMSVWKGPLLMVAFGLGTLPVMLLTGVGLTMTSLRLRGKLFRLAAICVMVTGVLTVGRGITFAANSMTKAPSLACPMCQDADR